MSARFNMQADVGFGDLIHPGAVQANYPALLERLANTDDQIIPEFGTAILSRIPARITNNPGIE